MVLFSDAVWTIWPREERSWLGRAVLAVLGRAGKLGWESGALHHRGHVGAAGSKPAYKKRGCHRLCGSLWFLARKVQIRGRESVLKFGLMRGCEGFCLELHIKCWLLGRPPTLKFYLDPAVVSVSRACGERGRGKPSSVSMPPLFRLQYQRHHV